MISKERKTKQTKQTNLLSIVPYLSGYRKVKAKEVKAVKTKQTKQTNLLSIVPYLSGYRKVKAKEVKAVNILVLNFCENCRVQTKMSADSRLIIEREF